MKIVSKYKDFYDFITQDYDADLVYVREPIIVYKNYYSLYEKKDQLEPYHSRNFSYYSRMNNIGKMYFSNQVFGIYPFVYAQPILNVVYNTVGQYADYITIVLSKTVIDNILNKDTRDEAIKDLKTAAMNELVASGKPYDHNIKLEYNYKDNKELAETLKHCVWKTECPEIFYEMKAPVFVRYSDLVFNDDSAYINNWLSYKTLGKEEWNKNNPLYVANISFNKLTANILKYWYHELFDINTYINIENFLWSIKQEPISTPDNNTKIIAHGFDLKTSFRKM